MMQDPTVDSIAIIDGVIKDWVDYSTISTYINCPFKCLLQYTLSIRSEKTALELIFGGAIHFGLETAYQWWAKNPEAGFLDLRAVAFEAFLAYWEAFANEHLQRDEEHIFANARRAVLGLLDRLKARLRFGRFLIDLRLHGRKRFCDRIAVEIEDMLHGVRAGL